MKRQLLALSVVLAGAACRESVAPLAGPVQSGFTVVHPLANQGGTGTLFEGLCVRETGKPEEKVFTFSGAGFEGSTYTLEVEDNGQLGLNGTIDFNGQRVFTHPMFGGNAPLQLLAPVTVATSNTIVCKLEGKPGSGVQIFVNP
jgi:hypothetical protein